MKNKQIEVFLRHCYYSKMQELPDRKRPRWFNKSKVFNNFKNTLDPNIVNYTIVYDEFYGSIGKTFLSNETNVEIIKCGNEADSFISTLDIIKNKQFNDDTIIYFLEDDYLHRPGWGKVLLEGFTLNPSYVTLYDFDFFISSGYLCEIFITESSHWRAVPGTTNTFACKFKTLMEDIKIHEYYSTNCVGVDNYTYSKDYDKFWELQKNKKYIVSPIPGWSTHCDDNHLSPIIDWEQIINNENTKTLEKNNFNVKYS